MEKWIECKISDIGTVVGGATPSTKKPENYENGDIAWITPKDLSSFSGRYIQRGERNITEIGLKSCSTQLLPKNTVLFSSRAPIGYVAIAEMLYVLIWDLRVLFQTKILILYFYTIC